MQLAHILGALTERDYKTITESRLILHTGIYTPEHQEPTSQWAQ